MKLIKQNQNGVIKKGVLESMSLRQRRTTLASIESLDIPEVQELVFLADFRCARCQQRIAEVMSKMNGETQSIVVSMLEKKVTLTSTYSKPARASAGVAPTYKTSLNKIALKMRLLLPSRS